MLERIKWNWKINMCLGNSIWEWSIESVPHEDTVFRLLCHKLPVRVRTSVFIRSKNQFTHFLIWKISVIINIIFILLIYFSIQILCTFSTGQWFYSFQDVFYEVWTGVLSRNQIFSCYLNTKLFWRILLCCFQTVWLWYTTS